MLAFLAHAEPESCPRNWSACLNSAIQRTSGQCWAAGLGLTPVPKRIHRIESHKQNTAESRARTGDFRDADPWRLGRFRPTLQTILRVTAALPWQVAAPPSTSAPATDLAAASPDSALGPCAPSPGPVPWSSQPPATLHPSGSLLHLSLCL